MDGRGAQERIAENQATFRQVNEAREPSPGDEGGVAAYVCECGRLGCTETVELTRAEYEAVRTGFDRFLLLPGHALEPDAVVEDHGRYQVALKTGWAAAVARETDPRPEERTG